MIIDNSTCQAVSEIMSQSKGLEQNMETVIHMLSKSHADNEE